MDIMEDDDQRIVALKRTYEDVIMNISKEAAARVMASERKSQQLEDELRVKKDEAVQIMLRLNMQKDNKAREEKNTSQNDQQKRIDELEGQLQEAEDIVSELRKELRYVEAKYESVIRNDEENRAQYNSHLQSQKFSLIGSDEENSHLYEYPKCPNQLIVMKNSNGNQPELPSIIRRSKKHMCYGKGHIQRILQPSCISLSREPNSASNKGKEGEQTEKSTCKETIDGVDKMFDIGSQEGMPKDDSVSCLYDVQARNLISGKGETIPKYTQNESTGGKKNHHKLFMMINGTPSDPNCKSFRNHTENNDKGDIGTMISKAESLVDMSVPIVGEEEKNLDALVSEKINDCELKPTDDATSEGPNSLAVDTRVNKSTSHQRGWKRGSVSITKDNMSAKNNTSLRKKARQNDSAEPKKSGLESDPSSLSFYLYGR